MGFRRIGALRTLMSMSLCTFLEVPVHVSLPYILFIWHITNKFMTPLQPHQLKGEHSLLEIQNFYTLSLNLSQLKYFPYQSSDLEVWSLPTTRGQRTLFLPVFGGCSKYLCISPEMFYICLFLCLIIAHAAFQSLFSV